MAEPPKTRPVAPPSSPPRLERAVPPGTVPTPGASYGLAAPEVTADAAVAAGLAQQGTLQRDSGLRLFGLCAATQASGRLTLVAAGQTFQLAFRKGGLEHVATLDPADALPRYLLGRGLVSAEQVARAEAAAPGAGGVAAALVTLGLVNPGDLVRHLQEHATQLLSRALGAEEGTWRWEPGVAPPPGAFPLGSSWALLCSAARGLDTATVVRRLGARQELGAARVVGRLRPEDLRLTPQESRAASLLDGQKLSDVARAHPTEAATILRVALLLGEVELVSFGPPRPGPAGRVAPPHSTPPAASPDAEAPPRSTTPVATPAVSPVAPPTAAAAAPILTPPPVAAQAPQAARPAAARTPTAPAVHAVAPHAPPAARPPGATPPPGSGPGPVLTAATLRTLLAKFTAKEADHFTVLGVKRDATPAQVKIAYFQLAKAYHPDTVATGATAEVKQLCADVFSRISEAWGVLGDADQRARYLDGLQTGAGVDVDVMNILQAENVFQAGTLIVKARRYDEAILKFEEAMKLNPEEAEFGMWKAWCEFLLAPDKKKVHLGLANTIEAGLKKNPLCTQGYLFLGQMAKLLGDLATAEKHLKRGLAVAPEQTDLQRELKYLRK